MLFTSYAELKSSILEYLNRPDLTAQVAGFIVLAEGQMRRKLRRSVGKATLTFTSGTDSKALGATVAELRSIAPAVSLTLPRGGKALTLTTMEDITARRAASGAPGRPTHFTVFDQTVYLAPAPSDPYLVFNTTYYTKLVPVATSTTLLTEAPDLYLYGACLEAAPYLEHDERIPLWEKRFNAAIDELNEQRQKEEFSASLSSASLPVVFG